jgi:membrane associated rhomboid family serine protease
MRFGFTEVVLLICAGLWLLHAIQLARRPFRRSWPSLAIAGLGMVVTVAAHWLVPDWSATVGASVVGLLLVVPAVLTRYASQALRWGHIGRARLFAGIAFAVRPIAAQRRFRQAVEISWALGVGDPVDLDQAVASLGPVTQSEARAHRVAFLSWANDFEAMAVELSDPRVRALAMRAGMAAIVTTVVGETGDDDALLAHWRRLAEIPAVHNRGIDATWALIAMAAYLGDAELVNEQLALVEGEIPPDRRAFAKATAEQRAGQPDAAEATLRAAVAAGGRVRSSQRRLEQRLERPRSAIVATPAVLATRIEVAKQLRARQALAELGLGFARPAPLTWAIAIALCAVFAWQTTQTRAAVFGGLGLNAPFARAPEAWRLLSYACVHLNVGHLLVNVLGLLVFGRFVERHYGWLRYSVVYLLGAIAGGAAYLAFETGRGVAIGASGAVLGLFGATVSRIALDRELRQSRQGKRELTFLASVAGLQLVVDALWAQSSGSAHAGGLAAGLVAGALLMRRR